MDVAGQRILIFGDSLSHHGADDAPEIWDVDTGANRSSSAPGDLLASLLLEQGAEAARVNANVSRSAVNFWRKTARYQYRTAAELIAADQAWQPTKVVVMLGTNDADSGAINRDAMAKIRDAYKAMGAEVWAIGPPMFTSAALNIKVELVYIMMREIFGKQLIDARPLTPQGDRANDGVHFRPTSAATLAAQLANALIAAKPATKPWLGIAIGVGVAGLLGLALWRNRKTKPLGNFSGPKERGRGQTRKTDYVYRNADDTRRVRVLRRETGRWDYDVFHPSGDITTFSAEAGDNFATKRDAIAHATREHGSLRPIVVRDRIVDEEWYRRHRHRNLSFVAGPDEDHAISVVMDAAEEHRYDAIEPLLAQLNAQQISKSKAAKTKPVIAQCVRPIESDEPDAVKQALYRIYGSKKIKPSHVIVSASRRFTKRGETAIFPANADDRTITEQPGQDGFWPITLSRKKTQMWSDAHTANYYGMFSHIKALRSAGVTHVVPCEGTPLFGAKIDLVDGQKWTRGHSPRAAGYKEVPCKAGLPDVRCWKR